MRGAAGWQTVIELRKNVQEWLPKLQTGDVILTAHMMRRGRDPMLEIALNLAQHVTAHVTDVVSSAGIVMSHAITVVVVGGDGEGRHDRSVVRAVLHLARHHLHRQVHIEEWQQRRAESTRTIG